VGKQSIVWFLTFSVTLARNYRNRIVYVEILASQRWDVFWNVVYLLQFRKLIVSLAFVSCLQNICVCPTQQRVTMMHQHYCPAVWRTVAVLEGILKSQIPLCQLVRSWSQTSSKPNSITLSASKLVRPASNLSATSFEPHSVMEFWPRTC